MLDFKIEVTGEHGFQFEYGDDGKLGHFDEFYLHLSEIYRENNGDLNIRMFVGLKTVMFGCFPMEDQEDVSKRDVINFGECAKKSCMDGNENEYSYIFCPFNRFDPKTNRLDLLAPIRQFLPSPDSLTSGSVIFMYITGEAGDEGVEEGGGKLIGVDAIFEEIYKGRDDLKNININIVFDCCYEGMGDIVLGDNGLLANYDGHKFSVIFNPEGVTGSGEFFTHPENFYAIRSHQHDDEFELLIQDYIGGYSDYYKSYLYSRYSKYIELAEKTILENFVQSAFGVLAINCNGDCTVFKHLGVFYIIDIGGKIKGNKSGDSRRNILTFLGLSKDEGFNYADFRFYVTHNHDDHSLGFRNIYKEKATMVGTPGVTQWGDILTRTGNFNMKLGRAAGVFMKESALPNILSPVAGFSCAKNDADFKIFWTTRVFPELNENSLIMMFKNGTEWCVLSGDLSMEHLDTLLGRLGVPTAHETIRYLKLPHHGSKYSNKMIIDRRFNRGDIGTVLVTHNRDVVGEDETYDACIADARILRFKSFHGKLATKVNAKFENIHSEKFFRAV